MSTIDDELTSDGESISGDSSESDENHGQKRQRLETDNLNHDDELEKLRIFKERNRLCAKRARLKKKIHLEYLESCVKTLVEEKAGLLERLGEPPAEDAADILLSLKGDSSLNPGVSLKMSEGNVSDNPSIDPESIHPSGLPMKLTRREKAKIQAKIHRAKNKQRTKMLEKCLKNLEKEVDRLRMREITNEKMGTKIECQTQIATNVRCQIGDLGFSITPNVNVGAPVPLSQLMMMGVPVASAECLLQQGQSVPNVNLNAPVPLSQLMMMGVPVASQSNGVLGAISDRSALETAKSFLLQQLQHLQQQQRAVEQQLQQLQQYEQQQRLLQQQQQHQQIQQIEQQEQQQLHHQQLHQTLLQHHQQPQQKLPLLQELLQKNRTEGGCMLSYEMPPLLLQEAQFPQQQ